MRYPHRASEISEFVLILFSGLPLEFGLVPKIVKKDKKVEKRQKL